MSYPALLKTSALKEVLEKIKTSGVPDRFSHEHLKTLGYKSSNDRPVIVVLKSIGFLDASEVPTDKYKLYRGKDGAKILAEGVRNAYAELFQIYPDANAKDNETLNHFFATKTNGGARILSAMVQTFKTLCSVSDFSEIISGGELDNNITKVRSETTPLVSNLPRGNVGINTPAVNINIELQIPATSDPDVYKNFFEAMKKYLLSND